jgi:hypothetical protein
MFQQTWIITLTAGKNGQQLFGSRNNLIWLQSTLPQEKAFQSGGLLCQKLITAEFERVTVSRHTETENKMCLEMHKYIHIFY